MKAVPLFRKYSIFDLKLHLEQKVKEAIRTLPLERLAEDAEKLVAEVSSAFAISLPSLDVPHIYQTDRQVQLDARHLPNRIVFNRSRPIPVDGTEITVHIPFVGDPLMFDVCPSHHNLNPPVAEVDAANREILLTYRTANEASNIKARYEATLHEIQQHLEWLKSEADQTEGLKQAARAEIAKRRQSNESHDKIVNSLGIPRRESRGA